MRCAFGLVFLGGMLVSLAAVGADSPSGRETHAEAVQLQQRIAQHQAEVEQLQRNVNRQESASQAAAARLQQQDRTIAELRKQLQAAQTVHANPAATH